MVTPPDPVGLALNLRVELSSSTPLNTLPVRWNNPDPADCDCIVPTDWQVEYESAEGGRRAADASGRTYVADPNRLISLDIGGLVHNTPYTVYVRGVAGAVAGAWSSVSAKTEVDPDAPAPVDPTGGVAEIPVGIPQMLTAVAEASIVVDWTAPDDADCACRFPPTGRPSTSLTGRGTHTSSCRRRTTLAS